MKQWILTLSVIAVVAMPVGVDANSSTAAFLRPALDPRAAALGQSFGAIGHGSGAIDWNPAGLAETERFGASFGASQLFETDYVYGRIATQVSGWGLGLGIRSASIGGSQATVFNPVTGIYEPTGETLSFRGRAFQAGVGRTVAPGLAFGLLAQFIEQQAAGFRSTGFSTSVGALWKPFSQTQFSITGRHLVATPMKWNTASRVKESLSKQVSFEAAHHLIPDRLLTTAGLDLESSKQSVHGGVEYWVVPQVAFRMGLYPGEYSLGSSLVMAAYSIDFSYTQFWNSALSAQYRLGIRM